MIIYNPIDGEAVQHGFRYRPRTCFLMSKLGEDVPSEVTRLRSVLANCLDEYQYSVIDAESEVTGRDFLQKIWKLILSVPVGIAVIHSAIPPETLGNIFFELGLLQAYGKETLVVKAGEIDIPSDFVRTEYIPAGAGLERKAKSFMTTVLQQGEHFAEVSDYVVDGNPLLAIDYLRRAYLILGDESLQARALEIFGGLNLEARARNSVEMLLAGF